MKKEGKYVNNGEIFSLNMINKTSMCFAIKVEN